MARPMAAASQYCHFFWLLLLTAAIVIRYVSPSVHLSVTLYVTLKMENVQDDMKELKFVREFKYLGTVIADTLRDDCDIEREIRCLFVRCNILISRFHGMLKIDCSGLTALVFIT